MVSDLEKNARSRRRRAALFRIGALGLTFGILELLSAAAAAVIPYPPIQRASVLYAEQAAQIRQILDRSVPHHVEIDPVLGWRHTPNFPVAMNRMNSVGLRGPREYARTAPVGVLRIAAFGDSFVYGAEVDHATSWAGRIEREHPDLELLNYGVAGYGVDQAYLRYLRDGKVFAPRVVLMGFVPDDINRTTSVYRRFLSPGAALFKPRYVLSDRGELVLLEVPLKTSADYENLLSHPHEITRIGRNDYWYSSCVYENPLHDYSATLRLACAAGGQVYRRYVDPDRPVNGRFFNENSSAFKIQTALFRAFSAAVRHDGALPLVVMLPDLKAVAAMRRGEPPIYKPLMDYLRKNDLPYLDAADAFRTGDPVTDTSTLFAAGGHYSALGNGLVAAWLANALRTVSNQPLSSAPASSQNTATPPSKK